MKTRKSLTALGTAFLWGALCVFTLAAPTRAHATYSLLQTFDGNLSNIVEGQDGNLYGVATTGRPN